MEIILDILIYTRPMCALGKIRGKRVILMRKKKKSLWPFWVIFQEKGGGVNQSITDLGSAAYKFFR